MLLPRFLTNRALARSKESWRREPLRSWVPVTSGNTFDSVRSHSYSVSGNFNQVTDPNGNISTSVEDAFGRLSQIIQPAPVTGGTPLTTSYGYDSNGNQTTVTNANGEQTKMAYDALNRQISKTLPDPTSNTPGTGPATTTSYDAAGNVVATADALGNDTTFVYNAWNQLVDQEQPIPAGGSIMGPITVPQTQYTYNAMGDLTSVQDPDGNTTSYTFNQLNEKTQETDPTVTALYEGTVQSVTPTKQYQYDLNGNVTQMTDGDGKVTNYTYDNLNRLTQETWQDSSSGPITNTISYTYDKDGHLTGGSDGNSSTTLNYNGQNQLAGASITFNGISATVATTLGYDQAGNNTSLKTTVNGTADLQNVYTYDNLNRLSSIVQSGQGGHAVAGKAIGFTYTNIGQINAITRYAGASTSGTMAAVTTNTYDHDDRLTQISNALGATGSTTVADSFGYDADGRITGESSTAEGSATLSYDRDNQLLSVTPTAAGTVGEFNPESYTYDLAGNRLSAQTGLATSSSTVSEGTGNELQSNANYSYTYDEDGNLSTRTNASNGAIDTYTWDNRDRLIEDQTKSADGTVIQTVTYTYSPITNQRLSETITTSSGTTTEYYFYDPNGNLLLVLNASGGVKERELTGQGLSQILASETNINGNGAGTVNWALTNQVGSVTDWVNNSGSVVGHVRYDSFGNIESQTGISSAMRFGYAGMQVDAATGLDYDNARYYDPETGTFISQDPLSFGGRDYNLQRYAYNDGSNLVDPSGLAAMPAPSTPQIPDFDQYGNFISPYTGNSFGLTGPDFAIPQYLNVLPQLKLNKYNSDGNGTPYAISYLFRSESSVLAQAIASAETRTQYDMAKDAIVVRSTPCAIQKRLDELKKFYADRHIAILSDLEYIRQLRFEAEYFAFIRQRNDWIQHPQWFEPLPQMGPDTRTPGQIAAYNTALDGFNAAAAAGNMDAAMVYYQQMQGPSGNPVATAVGIAAGNIVVGVSSLSPPVTTVAPPTQTYSLDIDFVGSPLRFGQVFELERLEALNVEKNTFVWRPEPQDIESAAFNVIVGKACYTDGGKPIGTTFDSTINGLLEIKGGASRLNSSYQLRLQTFYYLKYAEPQGLSYTLETTRPINTSFQDFLDKWGVTVVEPK